MCTGVGIATIVASAATAASAVYNMGGQKDPGTPAVPQPEKPPVLDLFKRRARTGGAYGMPDAGSLSAPSTGSTLLGQ